MTDRQTVSTNDYSQLKAENDFLFNEVSELHTKLIMSRMRTTFEYWLCATVGFGLAYLYFN